MKLSPSTTWRYALGSAVLAGVYFAAGHLGLKLAFVHENATAVWAPTGIAVAALLLWGYGLWPGIFLGAFLVNISTRGTFGDVATCLGIATGNTLEALTATYLVTWLANGRHFTQRTTDLTKFVLLAGLGSTLVSSLVGVSSLVLGGHAPWESFASIWFTWWLGDAVGAILVTPPIVLWANDSAIRWRPARIVEASLLLVALVAAGLIAFGGVLTERGGPPLGFLVVPVFVWSAIRFGPRETATGLLVVSTFAIVGTLGGQGPFGAQPPGVGLLVLQGFMAVIGLTSLLLASVVRERQHAENDLRQLHIALEDRVRERSAALARANEAFRWIMDNVRDYAIFILDLKGHIVTWNAGAERIMGYRADEIVGRHFSVFHLPEEVSAGRPQEILDQAVAQGRCEEESWRLRKDGSRYWADVIVTPLKDDAGKLRGFAKITRDMTARKEVDEKLRNSERLAAMGEMITGLAHESRNALQRAHACLELLQLKADDRPDLLELISDIEKAQDHLRYLFDEVRSYARPVKLKRQAVDLGKLLRETWQQLDAAQNHPNARLEEEGEPLNLKCLVDPVALGQVFRNILENSLGACADPVKVCVAWSEVVHQGRPGIRVALRDNGPGFSPEARGKLFEPFFTTKTHGTGLGMAIAKRIVEAHGGEIRAGANGAPGAEVIITVAKDVS